MRRRREDPPEPRRPGPRPPLRRTAVTVCLLAALALAGTGCGSSQAGAGEVPGGTLTVYSSLPRQGALSEVSRQVALGEKLALAQRGGHIGPWQINLTFLDDSGRDGRWDPGITSKNAREAAQNPTTIAYVGDLDSGATAISLPILNEAGILQVSPGSTLPALTVRQASEPSSPEKFYVSGKRTFARVVPNDTRQGEAVADELRAHGVSSLYVLSDGEPYGAGVAEQVAARAQDAGIRVLDHAVARPGRRDYTDLAQDVVQSGAAAVFYGGTPYDGAARLWRALHAAGPDLLLFGPGALTAPSFVSALGAGAARITHLVAPGAPLSRKAAGSRRFIAEFKATYGETPDTAAAFGYEAMSVVLDAIARAGKRANDRTRVVHEAFEVRETGGPLGDFHITPTGDVTLRRYSAYRVQDGRLRLERALHAG